MYTRMFDLIGNTPLIPLRRVISAEQSSNVPVEARELPLPVLQLPLAIIVSTADAKAMARRLAKEEAIFAGTSTGANIVAALRVAERLGSG